MKIAITKPLFAWDALEDSPSLQSLRSCWNRSLTTRCSSRSACRGKGRDDYPVEVLWGTLVWHRPAACLPRRLPRGTPTQSGVATAPGHRRGGRVPGPDNMSRFLATLGEEPHLTHLRGSSIPGQRLGAVVGDLGKNTAGDSTGLAGRARPATNCVPPRANSGFPNLPADARSTRTTTETSPRSSNGSATSCICSLM